MSKIPENSFTVTGTWTDSSSDQYGWGGSQIVQSPSTSEIEKTWRDMQAQTIATAPDTPLVTDCLVCGDETTTDRAGRADLCELCRQAVLLFRRKVLEHMARDLMEMSE